MACSPTTRTVEESGGTTGRGRDDASKDGAIARTCSIAAASVVSIGGGEGARGEVGRNGGGEVGDGEDGGEGGGGDGGGIWGVSMGEYGGGDGTVFARFASALASCASTSCSRAFFPASVSSACANIAVACASIASVCTKFANALSLSLSQIDERSFSARALSASK